MTLISIWSLTKVYHVPRGWNNPSFSLKSKFLRNLHLDVISDGCSTVVLKMGWDGYLKMGWVSSQPHSVSTIPSSSFWRFWTFLAFKINKCTVPKLPNCQKFIIVSQTSHFDSRFVRLVILTCGSIWRQIYGCSPHVLTWMKIYKHYSYFFLASFQDLYV